MTATIPPLVTETELQTWLTETVGEHIRDDYETARLLLATFDLAAKDGASLNNPHRIASSIDDARHPDSGPRWLTGPADTKRAAVTLTEDFRITRKPADIEQRLTDLPMPVVVSRHQCPFCRRYTRADIRAVQDHMGRCWQNPRLRCCKTCIHHQDGSHPEDDESCTHPDGPEPEDWRFPVLHCPLWQAAVANPTATARDPEGPVDLHPAPAHQP